MFIFYNIKPKSLRGRREKLQPKQSLRATFKTQESTSDTLKNTNIDGPFEKLQSMIITALNKTHVLDNFKKETDDKHRLASIEGKYETDTIIFNEKRRAETTELISIGDKMDETNHHVANILRNIPSRLNNKFKLVNDYNETSTSKNTKIESECTEFKVIDLAIAYDSTYCDALKGEENAKAEISSIVEIVSRTYQDMGLCLKVEVPYIEGFCDEASDPYNNMVREGVDSSDLLNDFRKYWNNNRDHVNRTVVHLFTATGMSQEYIGRGFVGSLCRKHSGYAIDQITWSSSLLLKANLVAHELAHNAGANHLDASQLPCTNDSKNYMMNPRIGAASKGFHSSSIENIREYIDSLTCLRTVSA